MCHTNFQSLFLTDFQRWESKKFYSTCYFPLPHPHLYPPGSFLQWWFSLAAPAWPGQPLPVEQSLLSCPPVILEGLRLAVGTWGWGWTSSLPDPPQDCHRRKNHCASGVQVWGQGYCGCEDDGSQTTPAAVSVCGQRICWLRRGWRWGQTGDGGPCGT